MSAMKSAWWWILALVVLGWMPLAAGLAQDAKKNPDPPQPKFTDVKFTSGGQTIKVWQYVPGEGTGPFPGVVLLHGIDGLDLLQSDFKVQLLYRTLASRIAQAGYVVQFPYYFHRTPLKKEDVPAVKMGFLQQAADKKDNKDTPLDAKLERHYRDWVATVRDAVQFIREDKQLVDGNRVAILGLSMGGFVGTSCVVEYPELKVSALGNIFGGMPALQQARVRKEKTKLPPILIMAGEEDDIVPEIFQRELFQLLRDTGNPGEAHFYGGVGHAFFDKRTNSFDQNMALNEALPTALRFLKRNLQPPQ